MSEGRKLGARGGTLGSREVVSTPKIGPTGGRDPKTYSSISITPYLNLAPPCSPWPPEPPWAPKNFLGSQEALGAFGSLQQPWVFSKTQETLLPLLPSPPFAPSCSLLPPEPPSVSLGPWNFPGASGRLESLLKPLAAFGSFGSSVRLRGLASLASPHPLWLPLTPSHPLSLPRPPWVPGTLLGPREALGAFRSLRQPLVFSQTQGPCSPLPPSLPVTPSHPPEPPWASLGPWDLSQASGSLGSL